MILGLPIPKMCKRQAGDSGEQWFSSKSPRTTGISGVFQSEYP